MNSWWSDVSNLAASSAAGSSGVVLGVKENLSSERESNSPLDNDVKRND